MGKALLVLVVAIGTALAVFWLAAPRLLTGADEQRAVGTTVSHSDEPITTGVSAGGTSTPGSTATSIAPPLTPEERTYEEVEAKRAPFYSSLRQNYPFIVQTRPFSQDQATLEIYLAQDDARLVSTLVYDVIAPSAQQYGFRRVRFYLPNAPGSVDRYRLDSESTPDSSGVWNTFRK